MKPKQRQTLKEILALWRGGLITSPVAIRRIGGVFVTTEGDFTSEEGTILYVESQITFCPGQLSHNLAYELCVGELRWVRG